jgi:hypothetical protein
MGPQGTSHYIWEAMFGTLLTYGTTYTFTAGDDLLFEDISGPTIEYESTALAWDGANFLAGVGPFIYSATQNKILGDASGPSGPSGPATFTRWVISLTGVSKINAVLRHDDVVIVAGEAVSDEDSAVSIGHVNADGSITFELATWQDYMNSVFTGLAYANGTWVACSHYASIAYAWKSTDDGQTWLRYTFEESFVPSGIATDGTRWTICASSTSFISTIITCEDIAHWTSTSDPVWTPEAFTQATYAIAYNGFQWLVAGQGDGTECVHYKDTDIWEPIASTIMNPLIYKGCSISWNGAYWTVAGHAAVAPYVTLYLIQDNAVVTTRSLDGSNETPLSLCSNNVWSKRPPTALDALQTLIHADSIAPYVPL